MLEACLALRRSFNCSIEESRDLRLRSSADLLIDNLSAFEDEKCRDTHHAVILCNFANLINIDFVDSRLTCVLGGKLFDGRGDGSAGAAPRRPEVYEDG